MQNIVSRDIPHATMARYCGRAVVILAITSSGVLVRYCLNWQSAFTVQLSELTEY